MIFESFTEKHIPLMLNAFSVGDRKFLHQYQYNKKEADKFFKELIRYRDNGTTEIIAAVENGELVGMAFIDVVNGDKIPNGVYVGYSVPEKHRRKGIASSILVSLCNTYKDLPIYALVRPKNEISKKMLSKTFVNTNKVIKGYEIWAKI